MLKEKRSTSYAIPVSIFLAGILIAGAVMFSVQGRNGIATEESPDTSGEPTAANIALYDDSDPMLGSPDAPVTIVEFSDFQCPFCKRFFDDAEQEIIENYIKTGQAKLVYRDFPLDQIHPYARAAAEAAECANEQGAFWKYHDLLFEQQDQFGSLDFSKLASSLDVDQVQFQTCVQDNKFADEVEKDYQDGIALNVTGTPTSFVNGVAISGAVPFSVFKDAIDAALQQ